MGDRSDDTPILSQDREREVASFATNLLTRRQMRHVAATAALPDRYSIRPAEEDKRYLCCVEAPEVKVFVQRGFSVKSVAAKKYPEGTIFLDGASQGEPFLDLSRQVLNLDHHEGCIRTFTLATCEQALLLTLRGLDIKERPWTIYANEPDLDTVLAIWVLLNGMHLRGEKTRIRRKIIPLVRLEGLIDAHGLELQEFSGFPEDLLQRTSKRLQRLLDEEKQLKASGSWNEIDFLNYTAEQLRSVDRMIYPSDYFEGLRSVEEILRVDLTPNRTAVLCRSGSGIYELETDLKKLYGKRLGLVILQKDPKTYTVRQVDPFLPDTLEAVYRKLNILDPSVSSVDSENRWGGSAEIGGSPRRDGSRLSPQEIAYACQQAFRKPDLTSRLAVAALSLSLTGLIILSGWVALWLFPERDLDKIFRHQQLGFSVGSLAASLLLLALIARKRPRLYGIRLPGGWDWLWVTPLALAGGLMGGVWRPTGSIDLITLGTVLAMPLGIELAFRSLAHGILIRDFKSLYGSRSWFLSWPVVISSLFYTLWTLSPWVPLTFPSFELFATGGNWIPPIGAVLFGISAAVARERSASVVAPLLLHYGVVLICLVLSYPLSGIRFPL